MCLQALANYLSLSMPQHGLLARACGFFNMALQDLTDKDSASDHEPLPRKRTFEQYSRDELMHGTGEEDPERKWREFDVLTRLRLSEAPTRECNACGRLTTASEVCKPPLRIAALSRTRHGEETRCR